MDQLQIKFWIYTKNHFSPSGMHLVVLKDQYNAKNLEGVDFHLKLVNKRRVTIRMYIFPVIACITRSMLDQSVTWILEFILSESSFIFLMKRVSAVRRKIERIRRGKGNLIPAVEPDNNGLRGLAFCGTHKWFLKVNRTHPGSSTSAVIVNLCWTSTITVNLCQKNTLQG